MSNAAKIEILVGWRPEKSLAQPLDKVEARCGRQLSRPPYTNLCRENLPMESIELTNKALNASDYAVVITKHSGYDSPYIADCARIAIDSRNALWHVKTLGATAML